jgi:hypothetical protein
MSENLVNGAKFDEDPVQGGTLDVDGPPEHPAVRACMTAMAAIGRSAVVVPERGPRTVLRVRYGPGGTLCPVRWMTRDEWRVHFCGKPLGHDDGEHQEPRTYELFLDGDDDELDWRAHRAASAGTPEELVLPRHPSGSVSDLPVLADEALDAEERDRLPLHRRYFTVQLRSTAHRRTVRPDLVTFGPLDQEEAAAEATALTDGTGAPWHRCADGLWRHGDGAGSGLPWYLLAFHHAPLTHQPAASPSPRGAAK